MFCCSTCERSPKEEDQDGADSGVIRSLHCSAVGKMSPSCGLTREEGTGRSQFGTGRCEDGNESVCNKLCCTFLIIHCLCT